MNETWSNNLNTLDSIPDGKTVRLVRIDAGRRVRSSLAALGLISNIPITIIRNSRVGQIILSVKSSKIILGRGISNKIIVREM